MASYEIQVASKLDSSDLAQISNAAFETGPIGSHLRGTLSPEAIQAYQTRRFQRDFARAGYEGVHYYKLVLGGETVAFAKWQFPHSSRPEVEAEEATFEEDTHEDHPPGYNTKLHDHFVESLGQKSAKWVDKEKDFSGSIPVVRHGAFCFPNFLLKLLSFVRPVEGVILRPGSWDLANTFTALKLLCVSPAYQRQGLGSILIQHGLDIADGEKARTYIEANANGLELYKRFGWKEVDEFVINMEDFGGNGMATETIMIRDPHTR